MINDIILNDFKEIVANSNVNGKTFQNKITILCFYCLF